MVDPERSGRPLEFFAPVEDGRCSTLTGARHRGRCMGSQKKRERKKRYKARSVYVYLSMGLVFSLVTTVLVEIPPQQKRLAQPRAESIRNSRYIVLQISTPLLTSTIRKRLAFSQCFAILVT